jgi:hypothetical protein
VFFEYLLTNAAKHFLFLKVTPYSGMELKGKVLQTILRGQVIYDNGKFKDTPAGKFQFRKSEYVFPGSYETAAKL